MIGAVIECCPKINAGKPRQNPSYARLDDPFFYRRDVFPGNGTSDNSIHEFKSTTSRERFELDPAVAELAVTAGLLFMPSLDSDFLFDCFFLRNFWDFKDHFDIEFSLELLGCGFDVDLPH